MLPSSIKSLFFSELTLRIYIQDFWVYYPSVRQNITYNIAISYFYNILRLTHTLVMDKIKGDKEIMINDRDINGIWKIESLKREVRLKVSLKM